MRTAAMLLGILGGLLCLLFGIFLVGISFGRLPKEIPNVWQFVVWASILGVAGGITARWRPVIGTMLMAASALVWLVFDWRLAQTINPASSVRGLITEAIVACLPPLLIALAIYLALKGERRSLSPPQ